MSMQNLLDRLKELDPDAYRRFRKIRTMTYFDHSPLDDPNITTPVYGWCLQGVIQDAITGRGWHWSIVRETQACIWIGGGEILAWAKSADKAILSVYIAALEVQE